MKKLICPKCLRTQSVTDNAQASCSHGRRSGKLNPLVVMIPLEQLTETHVA